ncbi:K02A2.6-like [Cordylochernes scorpioides]|uniref:K02A2.6-like n=1 Tax=Cordylochernes scorpioides TaxID=51811 RepID=A0ABY6LU43_9ARAC|nr:K02A2.6-like [Cordylochernes scorpioides]
MRTDNNIRFNVKSHWRRTKLKLGEIHSLRDLQSAPHSAFPPSWQPALEQLAGEQDLDRLLDAVGESGTAPLLGWDNGRQFVSGEFEQFTKMNVIRHTKTSPYNPSTNGLAERYVREFKNLLRKNNGKDDLETNLQRFLFAHRAFPQTVIKEFPRGTANEEKFKIKILEFDTKMGNPREVFHEAVRRQEQFTTVCEVYFRNYATGPKR